MKQATRCNATQLHLHTQRQRALGERMPADHDKPRLREVLAVLLVAAAATAYAFHHNLFPFN